MGAYKEAAVFTLKIKKAAGQAALIIPRTHPLQTPSLLRKEGELLFIILLIINVLN